MKWIKCSEQMPEIEDDVLVYGDLMCCVAYRIDNQYLNQVVPWVLEYERKYLHHNPTHWMPLPDAPEEAK